MHLHYRSTRVASMAFNFYFCTSIVVVAVIVGHEYVPIHFLAIVGRAIGSTVVGTEYGDGVGEQGARLVAGGTQSGAIGQIRVVPSLDRVISI